jgi:hypothetical protein
VQSTGLPVSLFDEQECITRKPTTNGQHHREPDERLFAADLFGQQSQVETAQQISGDGPLRIPKNKRSVKRLRRR